MKPISTAMALGRMLVRPVAGKVTDGRGGGCAWGMVSAGIDPSDLNSNDHLWSSGEKVSVELPCNCTDERIVGPAMRLVHRSSCECLTRSIMHLFNYHVMTLKDWTLDQLIDWVRENEPDVPEVEEGNATTEGMAEITR